MDDFRQHYEVAIDDDTPESEHSPEGFGRGWLGASRPGVCAAPDPFPKELLIDESEWKERIQEREAKGLQLSQRIKKAGLPCKMQSSTNYCWSNAPVHLSEVVRVIQNEPMIILSPASVACQITGFRNIGGYGTEAEDFIVQNGIAPVSLWPANAISRQYLTPATVKEMLNYRVQKFVRLQPRNINQVVSLLLRDIPVAAAFSWWGHEVSLYDVTWSRGRIAWRFRNSWGMSYGDLGFGLIQGNRMYADDVVAPASMVPYGVADDAKAKTVQAS